jgi:hypothetical protein
MKDLGLIPEPQFLIELIEKTQGRIGNKYQFFGDINITIFSTHFHYIFEKSREVGQVLC